MHFNLTEVILLEQETSAVGDRLSTSTVHDRRLLSHLLVGCTKYLRSAGRLKRLIGVDFLRDIDYLPEYVTGINSLPLRLRLLLDFLNNDDRPVPFCGSIIDFVYRIVLLWRNYDAGKFLLLLGHGRRKLIFLIWSRFFLF